MKRPHLSLCVLSLLLLPVMFGIHSIQNIQTTGKTDIIEPSTSSLSIKPNPVQFSEAVTISSNASDVWVEEAQSFYFTYSIWGDGEYFYTSGTGDYSWGWGTCMRVMKWHINGSIIWMVDRQSGDFLERDAYGYGIWGDNNGNVYACGYLGYYAGAVLLKIHSNGTVLWEKPCSGMDIWGDENYMYVCGGWGSSYHCISKWDFDGNEIWVKNTTCDEAIDIWGTDTYLYTTAYDGTVIKWDKDGNKIWNVTYGNEGSTYSYSVTSDGTSVYAGGLVVSEEGKRDSRTNAILVKWDQNGEKIWERYCSNETYSGIGSLFCFNESIYVLGGTRNVYSSTNSDIFLQKWDIYGNLEWNKVWEYTDPQSARGLWVNSTYIITSSLWRLSDSMDKMLVHLWDINGNTYSQPKPQAPTLESLGQNQTSVTLDWSDVENATSYNIYLSDEYPFDYSAMWKIANVEESNYVDYGVPKGTKYYAITAFNDWGESEISNVESIKSRNREKSYIDPHLHWYSIIGDTGDDTGEGIWGDEEFLYSCGTIWNYDSNSYDVFLAKWNKEGDQIWQKYWGDNWDQQGTAIWGDNNFLYTCGLKGSNYGILIKWDKHGNEIWNQSWHYGYSSSNSHWGRPSKLWGNEHYIYTVGGEYLIQWDTAGNRLWDQPIYPSSVWCSEEYVYAVNWYGNTVRKYSHEGNQSAYTYLGGESQDSSIWCSGDYVYISRQDIFVGKNNLVKLNLSGEIIWEIESDSNLKFIRTYGNKIITLGEYQGNLNLTWRDESGKVLNSWEWEGFEYDEGNSLYIDSDGIFVIGSIASFGSGNSDFILFKWSKPSYLLYHIIEIALEIGVLALTTISSIVILKRRNEGEGK